MAFTPRGGARGGRGATPRGRGGFGGGRGGGDRGGRGLSPICFETPIGIGDFALAIIVMSSDDRSAVVVVS
jgi:hypothetical protein